MRSTQGTPRLRRFGQEVRPPGHSTRAHKGLVQRLSNCVENLPVYGAIALAAFAAQTTAPIIDSLALVFIVARIGQTLVHTLFVETNTTVFIRFVFFFTQIVAMLWMAAEVARHASA